MPFPVVREQDAAQPRVADEADAEHVEALALHPVGAAIDRRQRLARIPAGAKPGTQLHRELCLEILQPGDELNLEVDVLAKYVEKLTHRDTIPGP